VKTKSAQRGVIVSFLDDLLDTKNVSDASFNGLQVQGKDTIKKVLFAVDAGFETFQKAVELQADMIVVHHGNFWQGVNPSLVGWKKERIALLFKHEISLYASHLPLDKHPDVGNNAQLLEILGCKKECAFGMYHGQSISFIGKTEQPLTVESVVKTLQEKINAQCKVLPFGPKEIGRIAVCSGGGADYGLLQEAIDAGVDLYLTGDSTEMYHTAKEAGINIIFAGHHATETVGVKALAEVVAERFGIETVFVDIPTGL